MLYMVPYYLNKWLYNQKVVKEPGIIKNTKKGLIHVFRDVLMGQQISGYWLYMCKEWQQLDRDCLSMWLYLNWLTSYSASSIYLGVARLGEYGGKFICV